MTPRAVSRVNTAACAVWGAGIVLMLWAGLYGIWPPFWAALGVFAVAVPVWFCTVTWLWRHDPVKRWACLVLQFPFLTARVYHWHWPKQDIVNCSRSAGLRSGASR
jgi:hypothetical protein